MSVFIGGGPTFEDMKSWTPAEKAAYRNEMKAKMAGAKKVGFFSAPASHDQATTQFAAPAGGSEST